ncbi:hypothetical protein ANCCAN_16406 [Ancylostoma caninum]|uniref:Uncharacterized protein n=1 Tax=Ancylostoma caninum TaxID=29170 RepID=A0A368FZU3_ANCCA|nr:hypothetical protein ANCCAN_16406 [Ancylostoma caninum]
MGDQMMEEQILVQKALVRESEGLHIKANDLQQRMNQKEDPREELNPTIKVSKEGCGAERRDSGPQGPGTTAFLQCHSKD